MRSRAEDSRVSDTQDRRKMMSSEQTETKVFGLLPNKQHLPPLNSHASTVLCFPPSLIRDGGKKGLVRREVGE